MIRREKDYFISRMFCRLLVPSLFSSVGFALADMMDSIVLGQRMGEVGLAATNLCLPLFMLINAVMDGLGIGGCVRFSQKLGDGRAEEAVQCFNRIVSAAVFLGMGMGLLANLFPQFMLKILGTVPSDGALYSACGSYARVLMAGSPILMLNVILSNFLRNDNRERLASIGFFVGNMVDFSLNILLVLVLNLGTVGAAASTVIGSGVAILIYLPGILEKGHILKLEPVKMECAEVLSCFRTGFSTSVQHLFRLAFFLLVNRLLMGQGTEDGVAIFSVVYSASFLILYLFNGTAEAAQPLVSTFAGEGSEEDARRVRVLSLRWGLLAGCAAAVVVFLFAKEVCWIFGIAEELRQSGAWALRIFCIGAGVTGINTILESYYQAKEEVVSAFLITSLRSFFILIPCTLLLSQLGIRWIWFMYPLTELLTLLVFAACHRFLADQRSVLAPERRLSLTIEGEEQIGQVLEQVTQFCERWQADQRQGHFVTMAVEEIAMSILQKAMGKAVDGRIHITLAAQEDGEFVLHFIDNAVKFDPFSLKSGRVSNFFEDLDVNAVGMMIVRKKAKEFLYRQSQGFNSLMVRIGN